MRNASDDNCPMAWTHSRGVPVMMNAMAPLEWREWLATLSLGKNVLRQLINPACCRWDNDPICNLPTEPSLEGQSMSWYLHCIQHKPEKDTIGAGRNKIQIFKRAPNLIITFHKIQLNWAIQMVLFPSPYLLWGTRNGTCHVSVYWHFPPNHKGMNYLKDWYVN